MDSSEYTMGLFLDLFKAFDTVAHNIVLYKLEHYGFRGIALDWFRIETTYHEENQLLNSN